MMRLQINVGKWTVSWALVAMLATWAVASVGVWTTGGELKLFKPALAFATAITLGWLATLLYRRLEARWLAKAKAAGLQDLEPWPDDLPAVTVFFGLLEGEDYADNPVDREGPPYGWLSMLLGLVVVCLVLYLLGSSWVIWVTTIALYTIATSVEDPSARRRLTRNKTELVRSDSALLTLAVPAFLAAWAVLEFGNGTLLGASTFWAVFAGWAGYTALIAWMALYDKTPDDDMRIPLIAILGIVIALVLFVAAAVGWLPWVTPIGYFFGAVASFGACALLNSGPLLDLLPPKKATSNQPCPD